MVRDTGRFRCVPLQMQLVLSVLFTVVICAVRASAEEPYETAYLVSSSGSPMADAYGINESGEIVGTVVDNFGEEHAALLKDGALLDLGTLGGPWSYATGINENGQVVGFALTADGAAHAMLYEAGQMIDLGTLGGSSSYAYAINDAGQVVGVSETPYGELHAFLYSDGVMTDLQPWLQDYESAAVSINNKGQVTGYSSPMWGAPRAFIYDCDSGTATYPAALDGLSAMPTDINNNGVVVGTCSTPDGDGVFILEDGVVRMVPELAALRANPVAINDNNEIAGVYLDGAYASHAFVYDRDGLAYNGLAGTTAQDINNKGQIVGYGQGKAFVATPKGNHPPGVALLAPGSGALVPVNTPVQLSGVFTDPDPSDSHTATWTISRPDQVSGSGTVVDEVTGSVVEDFVFTAPGIYSVSLKVADRAGAVGEANTVDSLPAYIVVYDPNGSFITGGGWIQSPAGAYRQDPSLTGKAFFGFASRYRKGVSVPDGQTQFDFRAAALNFHSVAFDWLVVSGAKAQLKGTGTMNGRDGYAFTLTVVDGKAGDSVGDDRFRMRIWDKLSGAIVYDNQTAGDLGESAVPVTTLGGGSIVVHNG